MICLCSHVQMASAADEDVEGHGDDGRTKLALCFERAPTLVFSGCTAGRIEDVKLALSGWPPISW